MTTNRIISRKRIQSCGNSIKRNLLETCLPLQMPLPVTESNEEVIFLKRNIAVKNVAESQNMVDFFCEWVKMHTSSGDLRP